MRFVYDAIYLVALIAISPWITWRYFFQNKNQRGWGQKLLGCGPARTGNKPCVWIHAVSVGEVNLLQPLIQEIGSRYPDFDIAISTTTETGFDLAKKKYDHQFVFFCPVDFSWSISTALRRIRPDLVLLTELELWPNLISIAHSKNVPVALINGRISQKSYQGYSRFRFIFSPILKKLELAIVQTKDYAKRLEKLGMPSDRVKISGNMKFDGLSNDAAASTIDAFLSKINISNDQFVFVAGSTQENEDLIAVSIYQRLKPKFSHLRLILVPRHPERANRLESILNQRNLPAVFRSKSNIEVGIDPIVVVDVIGELNQWWRIADLGYVGGSMGDRGGQNMIEPAAHRVPVCFGPDTENFKDVVALMLSAKAAKVVHNAQELENLIIQAITDTSGLDEMAKRGLHLVQQQRGSTSKTLDLLSESFEPIQKEKTASNKAA